MIRKIKEWFKDVFYEEYEVIVWFPKRIKVFGNDPEIIEYAEPKTFHLSDVSVLTQTEIAGKDLDGNPVIIKTSYPFNYNFKKIH